MYIEQTVSYYVGPEQRTKRANFLILMNSKERPIGPDNMRGVARKVALRQCGNFMMGKTSINGETIILSGTYGGDGLPITVSEEIFLKGEPVPRELYDAWNKGGGWNSAGKEGLTMKKWGQTLIKKGES
jgi:hypothetical protein